MFFNLSPENLKAQRLLHQEHAGPFLPPHPQDPGRVHTGALCMERDGTHGKHFMWVLPLYSQMATQLHTPPSKRLRRESQPIQENKEPSLSHFLVTLQRARSSRSKLCKAVINCDCFEGRRVVFCPRRYVGLYRMYWNTKRLRRFCFLQKLCFFT